MPTPHALQNVTHFDVIICGGGLAGCTLARQLKLRFPDMSIALIDKMTRPLPKAAHKVGESTVEIGSHYFGEVLGLAEYLRSHQLPKLGLRYFFGDTQGPLEHRPEFGSSTFQPVRTYQLDRGVFEQDLRDLLEKMGVHLLEGYFVQDILLSDDDAPHQVLMRLRADSEPITLTCRWVVDALSRRRLLQTKLGLKKENGHLASAAWWRMEGKLCVSDLVDPGKRAWHRRNTEDRYFSTNHLMGKGYWVWLIPLSSGATSLGIVTDETIHPFKTYGTSFEQAMDWLSKHEPVLARYLAGRAPLDFLGLKNYSYHSRQAYSHRRWSCVGEAAMFLDPFYSPGSDFIALGNTVTTEMIRLDREGRLTPEVVRNYNTLILELIARPATAIYRGTYATFGHGHIFTAKFIWDATYYWSMSSQLFYQNVLARPEQLPRLFPLLERYGALTERVQSLFIDWAARVEPRSTFTYWDPAYVPVLRLTALDLQTRKTDGQLIMDLELNLARLEELAQVLFFQAVSETLPDRLAAFPERRWVNAWAISLNPDQWIRDGLFQPPSRPRDLKLMTRSVRGVFAPLGPVDVLKVALMSRGMRFMNGRPHYWTIHRLNDLLIKGKPKLNRRLFLPEPAPAHETLMPTPAGAG